MIATTLPPDAERIKRRLWWLNHDPSQLSPRAHAELDAITDPLFVLARDTFQAGKTAVASVNDPALAALLDDILINYRPPKEILKVKGIRHNLPGAALAADLWQDIDLDPGIGEWPKSPKHRCKDKGDNTGAVITIRGNRTTVSQMTTPKWRDSEKRPGCPACYHKRVKRLSKQILYERHRRGSLSWAEFTTEAEYKKFTTRTRKTRERKKIDGAYCAYPQDDGRYIVIAESALIEGATIPLDRTKLYKLVEQWAHTPEEKRYSPSGDWGGNWQGTKGDGRIKQAKREGAKIEPALQLWTGASVEEIATALDFELGRWQTTFTIEKPAIDVYHTIAQFELFERGTNRQGLDAFLEFIGADVTHKGQENTQEKTMYAMRDNCQQTGGDPPPERVQTPLIQGGES